MAENLEKLFDNLALSISPDSERKPEPDVGKHSFDELCSLVIKRLQDDNRTSQSKRRDIGQFIRLIHIAEHEVLFPSSENQTESNEEENNSPILFQVFKALFVFGTVGQLAESEIGYTEDDFIGVAENAEIAMQCLAIFLAYLQADETPKIQKVKIMPMLSIHGILLTLEHSTATPWTTNASQVMAKQLQDKIFQHYQLGTISEFLSSPATKKVVKEIMLHIVSKMTKTFWKQNPSTKHIYELCLFSLQSPTVSDYLEYILPVSLLFLDDHELENKIHGIKCMNHIIGKTSKSELTWLGRAEVIHDSLQKLMYTHDAELISLLHPCLLKVLLILEPDPKRADRLRTDCRSDQIFNRFLHDMNLETKIVLRRAYSKQLPLYVHHMGITTLKHMKTFLHVVFGYLDTYDGPTEESRSNILDAIQLFITECWPRVPFHCEVLVKALVKFLYDISVDKTRTPAVVKFELVAQAEECLILVRRTCPEKMVNLLKALCDVELSDKCLEILQKVMEED